MYLVRDDVNGMYIAKHFSFQYVIDIAKEYMEKHSDAEGYNNLNIYTLSHTVEQKTERVPVEWETRTILDVQKIKSGG